MKLKEWIEPEPVGRADQLKPLAVEHRWNIVVRRQPRGRVNNVFHSDKPACVSDGFVDQSFRLLQKNLAIIHERVVDVMNTHRSMIRTREATKGRDVSGWPSVVHIDVLTRRLPDVFHELRWNFEIRVRRAVRRALSRSLTEEWHDSRHTPEQRQIQKTGSPDVNCSCHLLHTVSFLVSGYLAGISIAKLLQSLGLDRNQHLSGE